MVVAHSLTQNFSFSGNKMRIKNTNNGTPYKVIAPAPTRIEAILIAAEERESLLSYKRAGLPLANKSVFFVGCPVGASVVGVA
jgi:hypothetical protein